MSRAQQRRERLLSYAQTLVAAGFHVWMTRTPQGGFLTYKNTQNGCWGTLQRSEYEGWQHLMPLQPSREHGSHMFMEDPKDPWTVAAAEQCAQPTNYNHLVGTQPAASRVWLSPLAERITLDEETT